MGDKEARIEEGIKTFGINLDIVMAHVKGNWPFDKYNYPNMPTKEGPAERSFVIGHLLLHLQKSAGNIAQYPEKMDHGKGGGNYSHAQQGVLETIKTALRLAKEFGITGDHISRYLQEKK